MGDLARAAELGHGGNVVFRPGSAHEKHRVKGAIDGSFIFQRADGTEMFRLDHNGDVAIRGDVVTKDKAMYTAFAEWLRTAGVSYG